MCGVIRDKGGICTQVGMPPVDEVVGATLNYKLRVARGNVRKFLTSATEGVELGKYSEVVEEITKAVDEIEAQTGAPLDASNEKGWKTLQKRVEVGHGRTITLDKPSLRDTSAHIAGQGSSGNMYV
jgi:hypothetical protein